MIYDTWQTLDRPIRKPSTPKGNTVIKVYYDTEGDLLEIQFSQTSKTRRGIGLTEQITIFFDEHMTTPLALTVISYTKLLALSTHPLTELPDAPDEVQIMVKQFLQREPLSRFIHLKDENIELEDIRMSELVHP